MTTHLLSVWAGNELETLLKPNTDLKEYGEMIQTFRGPQNGRPLECVGFSF